MSSRKENTTIMPSIYTHKFLVYVSFLAIIVSYYVIVPREWVASDAVMTYGHSVLWLAIGVLLIARQKGLAAKHQYASVNALLCGYVAFLSWFCVRAFSYVT